MIRFCIYTDMEIGVRELGQWEGTRLGRRRSHDAGAVRPHCDRASHLIRDEEVVPSVMPDGS